MRVQLRAMPAIPFLDLQRFVIPPEEYIPERQANLSLEEIASAYSPPFDHPPNPNQDPGTTPDTLDDSEPRPMVPRAEVNQALEVLQLSHSDRPQYCTPTTNR